MLCSFTRTQPATWARDVVVAGSVGPGASASALEPGGVCVPVAHVPWRVHLRRGAKGDGSLGTRCAHVPGAFVCCWWVTDWPTSETQRSCPCVWWGSLAVVPAQGRVARRLPCGMRARPTVLPAQRRRVAACPGFAPVPPSPHSSH